MTVTPVVVLALRGVDAVSVVRAMTGVTNSRKAEPGTIRGDFGMSGQINIVHASDTPENAAVEVARFFAPSEVSTISLFLFLQSTQPTNSLKRRLKDTLPLMLQNTIKTISVSHSP